MPVRTYLHDVNKALDAYKRSTELEPDNMTGWNQLENLYSRIGELAKAGNAYKAVLELAGNDQKYQATAYTRSASRHPRLGLKS